MLFFQIFLCFSSIFSSPCYSTLKIILKQEAKIYIDHRLLTKTITQHFAAGPGQLDENRPTTSCREYSSGFAEPKETFRDNGNLTHICMTHSDISYICLILKISVKKNGFV